MFFFLNQKKKRVEVLGLNDLKLGFLGTGQQDVTEKPDDEKRKHDFSLVIITQEQNGLWFDYSRRVEELSDVGHSAFTRLCGQDGLQH